MSRDFFRVMVVDLTEGRGEVVQFSSYAQWAGGTGLAAALFQEYGKTDRPWDDPEQPLIFAVGPLTGYFPLMSKTVCGFKSPYHDQYAESHAGGRSALSMRFANLDALVVRGRAKRLSCLVLGNRKMQIHDVQYMRGKDVFQTGKLVRKLAGGLGSGHRTIMRIGPAGENGCAYACINADTYRHFGRLGSGGVMGSKNLKAIMVVGDGSFKLPEGKEYAKLFRDVYKQMTATDMMSKYHNLGTAANLTALNELGALPWRNLQATKDDAKIGGISGERFADDTLLRNAACAGCPVGCIHIGFLREKFMEQNQYYYRQVTYDYEPIFAVGSMLGMDDAAKVFMVMDEVEKCGVDVMSAGVALAWATEALEKGVISEKETLVPLKFNEAEGYKQALWHIAGATNDFYAALGKGTLVATKAYGGEDFACVVGQEMAGYATGEAFFVSEALGFRHSHLDSGGYSYDQKYEDQNVERAVDFFVEDERGRNMLTSMVSCMFARGVYKEDLLKEALSTVGHADLADRFDQAAVNIQNLRWQLKLDSGFNPSTVKIPKRFTEVVNWKGGIDPEYMEKMKQAYAAEIKRMGGQSS
jgi:aldehyde:ferredoxin oxidoreductase